MDIFVSPAELLIVNGGLMVLRLIHILGMSLAMTTAITFGVGCSNLQSTSRSSDAPTNPSADQGANADVSGGQTSQVIAGTNILSPGTLERVIVEGSSIIPILKNGIKARRIAGSTRIDIKGDNKVSHELFASRDQEFAATTPYLSFPIPKDVSGGVSLIVTNTKTGLATTVPVNFAATNNPGAVGNGGTASSEPSFLIWLHSVGPQEVFAATESGQFFAKMKDACTNDKDTLGALFQGSPVIFPLIGDSELLLIRGKQLYLTKNAGGPVTTESAGDPVDSQGTYFGSGSASPRPRLASGITLTENILQLLMGTEGHDCMNWQNFSSGASYNVSFSNRNSANIFLPSSNLDCSQLGQGSLSIYITCAAYFR